MDGSVRLKKLSFRKLFSLFKLGSFTKPCRIKTDSRWGVG